jgi:hypothetical protein
MPVIKTALHHVTFKTTRLDEMMAWYGTVLAEQSTLRMTKMGG